MAVWEIPTASGYGMSDQTGWHKAAWLLSLSGTPSPTAVRESLKVRREEVAYFSHFPQGITYDTLGIHQVGHFFAQLCWGMVGSKQLERAEGVVVYGEVREEGGHQPRKRRCILGPGLLLTLVGDGAVAILKY